MTVDEFKKKYYRNKGLLIKSGNIKRFEQMVKDELYDLE
jgi:ribosomal protein L16 Arg81 hydroxylase